MASAALLVNGGLTEKSQEKRISEKSLNLGMASYTFREFSLEDAISMTQRIC